MRVWLALLAVALLAAGVRADESTTYRVVVDRVEHEPSAIGGNRLRVFVSALALQGGLLDITDPKAVKVYAGNAEIKAPYALGRYAAAQADTAIVIVVEATVQYAEVLPVIADTMETHLLSALDESRTQLAVLPYSETLTKAKLQPLKLARAKVSQIQSDGSAGDPVLLDTIERALALLKKAKTEPEGKPLRKMIVVISDGRDLSNDRERVTRIGTRAAREGVRIHSFAHAPNDIRRPLLLLGELSKRSFGTFRWIRTGKAESWSPAFQQLRDEINQQYVLTYFLPSDAELANKKLRVVALATDSSNDVKIPEATCAGQPCEAGRYCTGTVCVKPKTGGGRGILGWILIIGGILVGAVVLLGVIGYIITKRQQRVPMDPDAIIAAAQARGQSAHVAVPPPVAAPVVHAPVAHAPIAHAPVAHAPISGPRLYIVSGPRAGEEIALRHGFLIGKQPGCDLMIDDGYTSSQHAQIGMDHFGNCRVYDRGSTNGTFVNGQRVTEYALEHGMSLRIGSTELRFLAQ